MSVEYREWRPCAALEGLVLAYWYVAGDGASVPSPAILPDAYVEIVVNLGDPVALRGSAFTGAQPARAVVGLLRRAVSMRYGSRVGTFGIRLHPARASAFLGVRAAALIHTVASLRSVSRRLDAELMRIVRANGCLDSESGRLPLEAVLLEHLHRARPSDEVVVRAVDRLIAAQSPVAVAGLARERGVSPRHLHRRFLAEVGVAPKRLERMARFARTWQQATMGPPLTWSDLALANGYADQAHLVREFRTFGAEPPAHLFTAEWYGSTRVARVRPSRRSS